MVGILVSFWDSLFSRAMLGFGSVKSVRPRTLGPFFQEPMWGAAFQKAFKPFLFSIDGCNRWIGCFFFKCLTEKPSRKDDGR